MIILWGYTYVTCPRNVDVFKSRDAGLFYARHVENFQLLNQRTIDLLLLPCEGKARQGKGSYGGDAGTSLHQTCFASSVQARALVWFFKKGKIDLLLETVLSQVQFNSFFLEAPIWPHSSKRIFLVAKFCSNLCLGHILCGEYARKFVL